MRPIWPFLTKLTNLTIGLKRPSHKVCITVSVREDIAWLATFCEQFNGVSYWLATKTLPDYAMASNASDIAGSAACAGDFIYSNWKVDFPHLVDASINVRELMAILLGVQRWRQLFSNSRVIVYTDNNVALAAVNRGTTRNMLAMRILRELYFIIHLTAHWVDSKSNALADAISRLHCSHFADKAWALLRECDMHTCAGCDLTPHMSFNSWYFLLQMHLLRRPY